ncbi:MAG: RagB/SusD family nutrient uptake outer membrane protein [Flavobacterium sp. BFFFF1]|uniref:RagB/SusD family nutrient uptake outer membrane protein n=1 Tax=Flavobacterium sp. BFFFF1 TaxID=2015557 RepID=UPI000BD9F7ED|nr:RagB/SusD family nutrient uptake outer membrane protein [Flavobacterium sp. BFFFF1]OYU82185.1 MAG: RagB/SusD family nutrient uptake outer membrane protein [Flavobacterium sp. BFFFF1]
MKKINFNFLYILMLFTAFISCTDEMNVVSEDDDVVSPEILFSTPQGYRQALSGVYGNLCLTGTGDSGSSILQGIDAGTSNFGRCLWYLQDLTTDEAIWSYENDAGTRELQRTIWTPDNPLLLGMFSRTMVEVALANSFLYQTSDEKVAQRGVTDATLLANIKDYRNEARALRAYAYYMMMDLFGKAPFVTENDPTNFAGPQYDRAQLFAFIESELNEVIPNLKAARTNEYGRIDKAFGQMVLAKMYLNAEVYIQQDRYSDCVAKCSEIIASGYGLKPNYLDNFKADNNTSEEMIFTLQSDGSVTQNYGATTMIINGQIGDWESNGSEFGVGGWGGAIRVRKQLVQKFDGGDFDFDARKTFGTGVAGNDNQQRSIDISDISVKTQGYILNKWSNKTSAGQSGPSTTFVNTDFPLFRLADVYLMYAEATLRGGNGTAAQALAYVNEIRERANGGSNVGNITSGQLTLDFILDERARELHWESHRRQDLIRFGKFAGGTYNWAWKGNAANGIAISPNLKVFPIPTASLNANRNLTQNTGY